MLLSMLILLLVWTAVSMGRALTDPALGTSASARLAEWFRGHGAASLVNWIEAEWYQHHQPPVGGALPKGAIVAPISTLPTTSITSVAHLPPPPADVSDGQPRRCRRRPMVAGWSIGARCSRNLRNKAAA